MVSYAPMGSPHPLGDVTGQTPISVNVSTISTQLLAANENRRFIVLSNNGLQDVFIAIGNTATVDTGLILEKGEITSLFAETESSKESINAVTFANTSDIAILEFE